MIYKRKLSEGVTNEHLKEFWKHRINPITGHRISRGQLTNSDFNRDESKFIRQSKLKFNKE